MLERLRIDGYRLLSDFEADLGQLTVVIGANATGKSTILDALSLITLAMDLPIDDALSSRGGLGSILNRSGKCSEIHWELTIARSASHPLWSRVPIAADGRRLVFESRWTRDPTGSVRVLSECLRNSEPLPGHREPLKLFDVRGTAAKIYDHKLKKLRPFNDPKPSQPLPTEGDAAPQIPLDQLPTPKAALLLSQMRFMNEYPTPTWTRAYLGSFCYYTGFDVGIGSPVRTKLSEIRPTTILSPNGENLGTVLHEMLTRHNFRDAAGDLREFLSAAYPYVEDISAETAYGGEPRVLVRVRERGLVGVTEVWELSDGMLRFLLLCAALLNPISPAFIAIDEPESGLHPKLLPIVADMIRSASERSQVLIVTHSPELLNRFKLDEIAVTSRTEDGAHWHRLADRPSLQRMLEAEVGGTIADLHASGELEAIA